jgi:3-phenylpropionate/cinnamic acid dioxygenase small subunit
MMEGLEERLRRLEDHQAILDTLTRYAWKIDHGQDEEWLDCFTEDGSLDIRYRQGGSLARPVEGRVHATGVRHTGRDQLAAFKAGHTRSPDRWHKHIIADPVIEIDGDAATAGCYLLRVDETDGAMHIRTFGQYRDSLVRGEDGRWRFAERVIHIEAIDRAGST